MKNNTAFFCIALLLAFVLTFVLGVIGITPKHPEGWAIMAISYCIGLLCYVWGRS